MSIFTVNTNPSVKELRSFGKAMVLGFGVLGAALWTIHYFRTDAPSFITWTGSAAQVTAVAFWMAGAVLCSVAFASPAAAKPVYVIWMTVANFMGMVMSTLLLTLLFFVLVPVFSLIVRRTDPMRKRINSGDTYWENYKPHEATIERMKRPF